MPTYNVNAADCPALLTPSGLINPASGTPTTSTAVVAGDTTALLTKLAADFARLDALGRTGAGAYAVRAGTGELTAGTGLVLNVSAVGATIDGPIYAAATTVALADDSFNWIWLTQAGTVTKTSSASATPVPAAPAAAAVFLGRVQVTAGAQGTPDYSGRLEFRGPSLFRRTADAGAPADTPPASLFFHHRTAGGLYVWTGDAYTQVG